MQSEYHGNLKMRLQDIMCAQLIVYPNGGEFHPLGNMNVLKTKK